jgi:hypothetical protein
MRRLLVVLCLTAVAVALPAPASADHLRQFAGTVVSVNRDNRTFRLRDDGRTFRIHVVRSTDFERLAGLRSLKAGMRNVQASVRRSANGRWIALQVERARDRDRDRYDDHGGPGPG